MGKEIVLILPTQLFSEHPLVTKASSVYILEHPRYFSSLAYHKQKLILHRASMQAYFQYLKKKKYTVTYVEHESASLFFNELGKDHVKKMNMLDPTDIPLQKELTTHANKAGIDICFLETPQFLTDTAWILKNMGSKKTYRMQHFYMQQRKRLNILMHNGKPVGGRWSFDDENRKPLPKTVAAPDHPQANSSIFVKEAQRYVEKHFKKNPGDVGPFTYPITSPQAEKLLDRFLVKKLKYFGIYQDAIKKDEPFLFHSLLSSSLNNGLLTPAYVIQKTLHHAEKHKTPINALEGFIRQIIGWREFVRAVYVLKQKDQRAENFFNAKRKIPSSFWDGTVGIEPIDNCIQRILKTAYAHHIERLMVLGNFMLLNHYHPNEVYQWFMSLFIDAYDWVMVPNVYGMALYADGGMITTKPYISSSRYILHMSDYKKGAWCGIWDALYWNFIIQHREKLMKINRLKPMLRYLSKIDNKKIESYKKLLQNI